MPIPHSLPLDRCQIEAIGKFGGVKIDETTSIIIVEHASLRPS